MCLFTRVVARGNRHCLRRKLPGAWPRTRALCLFARGRSVVPARGLHSARREAGESHEGPRVLHLFARVVARVCRHCLRRALPGVWWEPASALCKGCSCSAACGGRVCKYCPASERGGPRALEEFVYKGARAMGGASPPLSSAARVCMYSRALKWGGLLGRRGDHFVYDGAPREAACPYMICSGTDARALHVQPRP